MRLEVCDYCRKDHIAITIDCGFGSYFDGDRHEFCSDICMLEYYKKELAKIAKFNKEIKHKYNLIFQLNDKRRKQ